MSSCEVSEAGELLYLNLQRIGSESHIFKIYKGAFYKLHHARQGTRVKGGYIWIARAWHRKEGLIRSLYSIMGVADIMSRKAICDRALAILHILVMQERQRLLRPGGGTGDEHSSIWWNKTSLYSLFRDFARLSEPIFMRASMHRAYALRTHIDSCKKCSLLRENMMSTENEGRLQKKKNSKFSTTKSTEN